jgi:hypothetical protein
LDDPASLHEQLLGTHDRPGRHVELTGGTIVGKLSRPFVDPEPMEDVAGEHKRHGKPAKASVSQHVLVPAEPERVELLPRIGIQGV